MDNKVCIKLQDINFDQKLLMLESDEEIKELFLKENVEISIDEVKIINESLKVLRDRLMKLTDKDLKEVSGGEIHDWLSDLIKGEKRRHFVPEQPEGYGNGVIVTPFDMVDIYDHGEFLYKNGDALANAIMLGSGVAAGIGIAKSYPIVKKCYLDMMNNK